MNKIRIIGLGTGGIDELTVKAYNTLLDGSPIFIRTERHPIVNQLKEKGIDFVTFDNFYENIDDFEELYNKIIAETLDKSKKYGTINYCTAGSPYFGDVITEKLLKNEYENIQIEVIDGISFFDKGIKLSGFGNNESIKILDCVGLDEFSFDVNSVNVITQVYNKELASQLKLNLIEIYPDDLLIRSLDVLHNILHEFPLFELDRQKKYDFSTYICIPTLEKANKKLYNTSNLCRIMKALRGFNGCPWDRKQTHESLRECVIEEAYEVVDAIDSGNTDNLEEELGDLLLQVVFHSQIASEEGYFNINDVLNRICSKLYFRHPHVFGKFKASNACEARNSWEEAKSKEKNVSSYTETLERVPKSLSPLSRSYKIQKRAAVVGFDWPNIDGAIEKVKEELNELTVEYEKMDIDKIEDEFGDLLFALVNFVRFLDINPDVALNKTINKFITRFRYIEDNAPKDLKSMTLDEMDALWDKSKFL